MVEIVIFLDVALYIQMCIKDKNKHLRKIQENRILFQTKNLVTWAERNLWETGAVVSGATPDTQMCQGWSPDTHFLTSPEGQRRRLGKNSNKKFFFKKVDPKNWP